ncbi:MAG: hypothetical protein COY38_05245 [Candidatus Aenigmarchaeota archaeon CG_4_10_14_0_8_um_filter_37_24]
MPKEKKRGGLLTAWLILMIIANSFTTLTYLFLNSLIIAAFPNVPSSIFYIYGALELANVIFAIFLFKWKKWAFFAFCTSAVIIFIMNVSIGLSIFTALFGLIGIVILYLILKPKWNLLE